jgi:hypothetical protein
MSEPARYVYEALIPSEPDKGQSTEAEYEASGRSAAPGPVAVPDPAQPGQSVKSDPELVWLASDEATQYEGHWVALDPDTGQFLGLADTRADLRRWREQDISVLFVEPRHRAR